MPASAGGYRGPASAAATRGSGACERMALGLPVFHNFTDNAIRAPLSRAGPPTVRNWSRDMPTEVSGGKRARTATRTCPDHTNQTLPMAITPGAVGLSPQIGRA